MFKKLLCLVLILFAVLVLALPQKKRKLEKVTVADLEMKTYERDTTAEAVVLHDEGMTLFEYSNDGFVYVFSSKIRIKILSEKALRYADYEITYKGNENLGAIKAYTYNLKDGKVVKTKLKKESKFIDKISDYTSVCKLSLPEVQVGSIIEIEYKISSDNIFNLKNWYFQSEIPVVYSYYHMNVPDVYGVKRKIFGYENVEVYEKIGEKLYANKYDLTNKQCTFIAENLPAFKDAEYLPCSDDYISKVSFELAFMNWAKFGGKVKRFSASWESIFKNYKESEKFGYRFEEGNILDELALKVKANANTDEERIKFAYNMVKNHLKWKGYTTTIIRRPFKKVWEEGNGSSAEINMLFLGLLERLNITAYPLFISTTRNGKIYPFRVDLDKLNDVLVYVPKETSYNIYDLTNKNCPMGQLPFRCVNGDGIVMTKTGIKWVKVEAKLGYYNQIVGNFKFTEEGAISGGVLERSLGYDAIDQREEYEDLGSVDKYKEEYLKDFSSWEVSGFELAGEKDLNKPFDRKFELKNEDVWFPEDERIYFNPLFVGDLGDNSFDEINRKVPVDFIVPRNRLTKINIQLPEGYVVEELPKAQKVTLPGGAGSYLYNIKCVGNMMQLTQLFKIKKTFFLPEEYAQLKAFYDQVMEISEQSVVLKKQNESMVSVD